MSAEGWNGQSVRQHVEGAAGEAARAHERIDVQAESLIALGKSLKKLLDALALGGVEIPDLLEDIPDEPS